MTAGVQAISPADIFVREFGGSAGAIPNTVDREYTRLFIRDFRHAEVLQYHRKFQVRFEKNVKHRQQVALVRKYLREDTVWLDAPIGSGRLMDELRIGEQTGFDRSPAFLAFNRAKGRTVIDGDLLEFPFRERFDLITTLHTLPAFTNFRDILVSLVRGLRQDGVLIVDVNSSRHAAARRRAGLPDENPGMGRREIHAFFSGLKCTVEEIHPHDYFDSPFVVHRLWNPAYRIINKAYFKLRLFRWFDWMSRGRKEHVYTKYLLVVRKTGSSRPRP